MARPKDDKQDDKEAVNELSSNEAHKLPQWLRVVFNIWRIIHEYNDNEDIQMSLTMS